MAQLALALLGAPQIRLDGAQLRFDTRKAVALLAYLACTRRAHRREALAALLWPEYTDARNALRRTLSALQHGLGAGWIEVSRDQIALVKCDDLWLDVAAFEVQLVGSSDREALASGLALYRDTFLAGFTLRDSPSFDEWQFFEAERLRQLCASGLERLATLQSGAGDHEAAIESARRHVALDPLHEPAHRALMRHYHDAGQRAAALRQYRLCAQRLEQELGVPPSEETVSLYETIKATAETVGARRTNAVAGAAARNPTLPTVALVGRSEEQARLRARHAAARGGVLVVISGSAGIGKSALAEDLLATARAGGGTTIVARCYEGEAGLSYAPIAALLREATATLSREGRLKQLAPSQLAEAARLVPALAVDALRERAPLAGPDARRRFFEAVSEILLAAVASTSPGVIVVDDAHWADGSSLDLLAFLSRRLRGQPGMLLLIWRDEDVSAGHSLRSLLAEARRNGSAELIALAPLSAPAVVELVSSSGLTFSASVMDRLYTESEGVPFLLVEYLAALREQALPIDAGPWPLPGRARDMLEARLRPLGDEARGLVAAAAVIGRAFDLATLCVAAAVAEENAVDALEELLGRRLIVETSAAPLRYAFSHERLRSFVYEGLSQVRRRLFHRRVAVYLAGCLSKAALPGLAAQVAQHAAAAGETALAATHFYQAGDEARALAANAEAQAHYAAALAAGHPARAALYSALGDLRALAGEYSAALSDYAAACAAGAPDPTIARKTGEIYHRLGEWEAAESEFASALADPAADAAERARALAARSLTARRRGDLAQAARYADASLNLAEAAADPQALARAHGAAGALAAQQGDVAQALLHLEEGLRLAEQVDDPETPLAALNNLALALAATDRSRAIALAERALALCLARDDRHRAAALHNTLADLRHAGGEREAARAHLREAVALFAAIGHDQPAIWMFTEW
jgi:DNA-binding SARP family transcriptional activator